MNYEGTTRRSLLGTISGLALGLAYTANAQAQAAPPLTSPTKAITSPSSTSAALEPPGGERFQEIVVTAQKRSQSINKVGMSIVALPGAELLRRGVTETRDLVKIVPGFTYTPTAYATPVYTLRGVGLYDNGLSSSPAVSVYIDQVAIPFPTMTTGVNLDLARVEVLKGPQGTLFGQNSTGGAINYIAAKPTNRFEAGGSVQYERFNQVDTTAYVSGPLSDTVRARLAFRSVEGGDWQYSVTRPNDKIGANDQQMGRFLLDWDVNDRFTLHLNLNGFRDRSDTQQPQFQFNELNITKAGNPADPFAIVDPVGFAARTNPLSPAYEPSFLSRQAFEFARLNGLEGPAAAAQARAYLGEPTAPNNARAADWSPGFSHLDKNFGQGSVRADYRLTDQITLTSITAGEYLDSNVRTDLDATPAQGVDFNEFGSVRGFNEELRLSGDTPRLNWVGGLNYDYQDSTETQAPLIGALSTNEVFPGVVFKTFDANLRNTIKTYAAFGNAEYKLTRTLSIQGAVRYTENDQRASFCSSDPSAAQSLAETTYLLEQTFGGMGLKTTPVVPIGRGQCYVPTPLPDYTPTLTPINRKLNQNNVSWRVGLTNKFDAGLLLYANASRGFKSGIFSPLSGSLTSEYVPAQQERLDAYEAGFKAPISSRVQFNGAGFYYYYANKQVRSRISDPIFGSLEKLINVPESRVWGVEAELVTTPLDGLRLSASGTYLNSRILNTDTIFFNQAGYRGNFAGSRLPFTPEFTGVADAEYDWSVGHNLIAMVGSSLTFRSDDIATFSTMSLPAPGYSLPAYTLLDLRAGISAENGSWNLQVFGHNVTDKYYYDGVFQGVDSTYRYSGRPMTYGFRLSAKFR